MFGLLMMFVLYAFIFVTLFAEWHSERISADPGKRIVLQFGDGQTSKEMLLLGSTANYLFTYDSQMQKANIYPVQNINRLEPVSVQDDAVQPPAPPVEALEPDNKGTEPDAVEPQPNQTPDE